MKQKMIRADDPLLFKRKVDDLISYRMQNGPSLTRDYFMRIETAKGKEYTDRLKAAFLAEWKKIKGERNAGN